jgi:hypothetical protein
VSSPPHTAGPSKPRGQPSTQARRDVPVATPTQAYQDATSVATPSNNDKEGNIDQGSGSNGAKGGADITFIQVKATPNNLLGKRKCIGQHFTDWIK